jgi:hypothetical protein
MLKPDNKFKFTPEYQYDLLRFTVQDKKGELALNKFEDDYFTLIEHQVIAFALKKFYKKERRIPGETILREAVVTLLNSKQYVNLVTKNEQKEILDIIKPLYTLPVKDGDIIYDKCKEFKSYVQFKNLIENVDINDFNSYALFAKQMAQAVIIDEDAHDDLRSSFLLENIKERQFKRQANQTIFPTPFEQVNRLTNAGGYEAGSIIVILDKQKKGKTATLANVARGYLKMRKKILIIDLENGQQNIFSRLEQSIMDISKQDLMTGEYDNKVQARFRKYKRLGGEIVVRRLPALTTTCNDIQREMDALYRDFGFKPEIIIMDYAAKLGSISGKDDERGRIADSYIDLGNLALANDIEHIWTANHVTRDGARARMKTRYQGEDIALCIDIVRHAHAIFGLNRSEVEEEAGFFRMELVEQRDGKPNGRAVFKANMDTQRFDELNTKDRKEYDEAFATIFEEKSEIKTVKKERKDDFAG